MNQYDIAESVEFNSKEIASVIEDCEYTLNHSTAENDRRWAKISAYEYIHDIIFGQGESE